MYYTVYRHKPCIHTHLLELGVQEGAEGATYTVSFVCMRVYWCYIYSELCMYARILYYIVRAVPMYVCTVHTAVHTHELEHYSFQKFSLNVTLLCANAAPATPDAGAL
jgi:hypothetical protein